MRTTALLCVLAAAACGKHHDRQPAAATSAEAGPSFSIEVKIDRTLVRTITAADVGTGVELVSLLPAAQRDPSRWYSLHARAGERQLKLDDFARSYGDLDARVEPGPRGPTLALYRKPPPNAPPEVVEALKVPRQRLVGVELIKISTHEPEPVQTEPWSMELVAGSKTKKITTDDLAKLKEIDAALPAGTRGPPGDRERQRRRGWPLADVVALLVPPKRVAQVTVFGDTSSAVLTGAELADATIQSLLAANAHGAVGLRVFRGGKEMQRVRRITRVTIEPKARR